MADSTARGAAAAVVRAVDVHRLPAAAASLPAPAAIGVISDTHGLVRPEAVEALAGVDLIVHAGDVCGASVLERLRRIAPVVAVRGNNDPGPDAALPDVAQVIAGGHRLLVLHALADLRGEPATVGMSAVISGHSHRPQNERRDGVLYLNPGSAGPRRFSLPVTLARLVVHDGALQATIVSLGPQGFSLA